jgi:hypothetical protein
VGFELTTLVVIGTDCIGSCKSNYHTIITTMAPSMNKRNSFSAHGRWFSPGTSASSTTKSGRHDIAEILLIVTLSTINQIIDSTLLLLSCFTTYLGLNRMIFYRLVSFYYVLMLINWVAKRISFIHWWGHRGYDRMVVECTFLCNLQSRSQTHAVLVIGLYELLGNPTN